MNREKLIRAVANLNPEWLIAGLLAGIIGIIVLVFAGWL